MPRFYITYQYRKVNSSGWGSKIVTADDTAEAASKLLSEAYAFQQAPGLSPAPMKASIQELGPAVNVEINAKAEVTTC